MTSLAYAGGGASHALGTGWPQAPCDGSKDTGGGLAVVWIPAEPRLAGGTPQIGRRRGSRRPRERGPQGEPRVSPEGDLCDVRRRALQCNRSPSEPVIGAARVPGQRRLLGHGARRGEREHQRPRRMVRDLACHLVL